MGFSEVKLREFEFKMLKPWGTKKARKFKKELPSSSRKTVCAIVPRLLAWSLPIRMSRKLKPRPPLGKGEWERLSWLKEKGHLSSPLQSAYSLYSRLGVYRLRNRLPFLPVAYSLRSNAGGSLSQSSLRVLCIYAN